MSRLVLVLGDQLTPGMAALKQADKARDVVVMAEVAAETDCIAHHPKKIALIFAAMRKFARRLAEDGWTVRYSQLDDTDNAGSIPGELLRRAEETGASEVLATEPGDWRLIEALQDCPLKVRMIEDDRFFATHETFEGWAEGRKSLRMEYFYREMRRKTGYLMNGDAPEGGQWNYDSENRKPPPDGIDHGGAMMFTPDETVEEVLDLVEARFSGNFGELRPFAYATDTTQARRALTHFIKNALPQFGDYQDAMLRGERHLYHSVLSPYLNIGLLTPREVCDAAAQAYAEGAAPLNAVEGFIRQILGWREYVRGMYYLQGPDYLRRNALNHQRKLPGFFWGAETRMACVAHAVDQTREDGYAHHIQRLMVTGNFSLIAGLNPQQVHEWYLASYVDAFDWVMAANTIGMTQFADGGLVASKPYVSSGNYIDRMSDYCKACHYSVKARTGEGACPFNLLYWHFLNRHRDRFENNPRMGNMYRTWDRMDETRRSTVLREAEAFLDRMSAGKTV
ncbi:cryptochrome/photolyase family protein [Salipiger sp.]|uniref:cryptochrome/photolyase family protein n=1 Tax=Salipiger sp. TaxID=2078585 RepID=UPI003A979CBB